MTIKVLFVCLGNICRSPTAEGVFKTLVENAGLNKCIETDSAGTAGWHQGETPDFRTIVAAKKRGFDLSSLRARQVLVSDFDKFDYIFAMDSKNLRDLLALKPNSYKGLLDLFLTFSTQKKYSEVPDPYHGNEDDFELVLDLVEDAANNLLNHIRQQHPI